MKNDLLFKILGIIASLLYASSLDRFIIVQALDIRKPMIRMIVFAMSIFWASVMVKYEIGLIWVAVNTIAAAVIPQTVMEMARERRETREVDNNTTDKKENDYENETDA